MRRFLLFMHDKYDPNGGWYDLQGSYDSVNEAELAASDLAKAALTKYDDWNRAHIVDTAAGRVVRTAHSDLLVTEFYWIEAQ